VLRKPVRICKTWPAPRPPSLLLTPHQSPPPFVPRRQNLPSCFWPMLPTSPALKSNQTKRGRSARLRELVPGCSQNSNPQLAILYTMNGHLSNGIPERITIMNRCGSSRGRGSGRGVATSRRPPRNMLTRKDLRIGQPWRQGRAGWVGRTFPRLGWPGQADFLFRAHDVLPLAGHTIVVLALSEAACRRELAARCSARVRPFASQDCPHGNWALGMPPTRRIQTARYLADTGPLMIMSRH